VDIE
jgi:hypothetical protein